MPFYQQIITLKPHTKAEELTRIFRRLSQAIVRTGGVVRVVENHGLRHLPYRFHAGAASLGETTRWYKQGRWVSMYFDANPAVHKGLKRLLMVEESVLRSNVLKPQVKMERITTKHKSNPWLPNFDPEAEAAAREEEFRKKYSPSGGGLGSYTSKGGLDGLLGGGGGVGMGIGGTGADASAAEALTTSKGFSKPILPPPVW